MSAFVVSPACMGRVVNGLYAVRAQGGLLPHARGIDALMAEGPDAIASALYALNTSAVEQRYPGDPDMSEPPTYKHAPVPPRKVDAIAAYKSMVCLHYQCSEGEAVHHFLYTELEEIYNRLAYDIISRMPAFEAAEWG